MFFKSKKGHRAVAYFLPKIATKSSIIMKLPLKFFNNFFKTSMLKNQKQGLF